MTATLYIVPTPIGNLKDITLRALEVLEQVEWIACEDTRHSKKLLQHFAINKPLISLHDHNENDRKHQLLEKLKAGKSGALVSDAGTPLISDPGYHLVSFLRENEISVVPLPGPSAVITALSAAGLPTDRFSFEGFLPAKTSKRLETLKSLQSEARTMVFYESPHRLMDSLSGFSEVFPSRQLVVAKELTKQFELFFKGAACECSEFFAENPDKVKGEFVLILAGESKSVEVDSLESDRLIKLLLREGFPVKQIAHIVSDFFGLKKKQIYQRTLDIRID